ncbi:MAG: cation:proton antiporter [Proteobacteria bacterium]|nr:cation:proton antiporter [Pseudomonadota bacterium]
MTDPLAQLLVIWIGVFIAVYAAKATKLTPVLFYLAVGAVAVNTGILPHEAHPFIRGFAEIGIIVIMFALGFEESPVNFLRSVKRSWGIAFFGALAPFAVAYSVADYFWGDTNMSMMFGLAMTATAVSLTMVSLKGEGLARSAAATGIMTSAVLDDIASLAAVAVLVSVATGEGSVSLPDVAWIIGKVFLFFALITFVGAWVFPHERPKFLRRLPFFEQFAIRRLFRASGAEMTTLAVLTLALAAGIASHQFGFHPAIGAYMAGLILREEYFDMPATQENNQFENTKRIIDSVAFTWIGPVFFVQLGTMILFDWDIFVSVIPQTLVLTTGLFLVQVSSAGLAARYTGGFTSRESLMIGFGMLGRAELAFVVMDIAYVQNSILNDEAFYTLMFTAFWLNVAVPITIAWWKPYYAGEKEIFGEKEP